MACSYCMRLTGQPIIRSHCTDARVCEVVLRNSTGPIYFVFCRLYPFSPSSVWLLPLISLLLTYNVSRVRACLTISSERFRGNQMEDECALLSILFLYALWRNTYLCIPINETARPRSQFLHPCTVSVSDFFIPKIGLPVWQKIVIMFWKEQGHTISFLGIHKSEADIYIGILDSHQPFICSVVLSYPWWSCETIPLSCV